MDHEMQINRTLTKLGEQLSAPGIVDIEAIMSDIQAVQKGPMEDWMKQLDGMGKE